MDSRSLPDTARGSTASGYPLAILSSLAGAAATVVGKWNLNAISPLLMNSLIFTVATGALSIWVLPRIGIGAILRLGRRQWIWIGLFTVTSWFAIMAFWAGVQKMDPTLAAFLNRSEVLVAILLGILFLRERFNFVETAGVLLSLAGIVVMRLTLRGEYSEGFWLVLIGSLFFGLTEFVSKIAVRHVDPLILTYVRNAFLAAGYWIVFFSGDPVYDGLGTVWVGVIALGFLGPIFSRMLYVTALQRLDLSKVAVISQSQPVWVILIALAFLHQLPTLRETVGGLLLLAGCLLMIAGRWRPTLRSGTR